MSEKPAKPPVKKWQVEKPVPKKTHPNFSDLHPILLQLLWNRGLKEREMMDGFLAQQYLAKDDPFLLTGMKAAVKRITAAIENDERIVIYGDFDADGVTSTVLLTNVLRGLGVSRDNARPYIPDRIDEGYGLNFDALTEIKEKIEADLVITVDCGIRSVAEVAHANKLGLDMIVTDHHSVGEVLPPAVAVINPHCKGSNYPEKNLAGVGVAYKLAQALHQSLPDRSTVDPAQLLDLVAIGTVADIVPLLGENRKLVSDGLMLLNKMERPGVNALVQIAKLKGGGITAESIGFGLAPRINAAGRLAHAYDAAKLLAAPSQSIAEPLAQNLDSLNQKRQTLTQELSEYAEKLIDLDAPILIVGDERFQPGIVGLIASRLSERHYRPSIVMERGKTESRGSCRSIPEFHITHALDQAADLLVRYGGHAQAAGFTILNENLDTFTQLMTEIADDQLSHRNLIPTLKIDANISLRDIDWALIEHLARLEPTGAENREPLFMTENVQVLSHKVVGQDQTHLQLDLTDGEYGFKAIAFRQAAWAQEMPRRLDIVYAVGINEFRGRKTIQLRIEDMRLPLKSKGENGA